MPEGAISFFGALVMTGYFLPLCLARRSSAVCSFSWVVPRFAILARLVTIVAFHVVLRRADYRSRSW